MRLPEVESATGGLAEAAAFFLAVLAFLWWLAIPFPWAGILIVAAVVLSWRRRRLSITALGLGLVEFGASFRSWRWVWLAAGAVFAILGGRRLLDSGALTNGAVYFAWAAVQQAVYQSMTYLPLRSGLKRLGLATVLGGAAFAAMHVPNPVLVPATLVWGVASCILFERCRSVWGLALLQMMLSSSLFWVTPAGWHRQFQIGPYYYRIADANRPPSTFAPPALEE